MKTLMVAVALVAVVGSARAEDDAAFVTLDRVDGVSRAGVEMSYVTLDPIGDDVQRSGLRFEAHAQSVSARTGWGMYESIPVGVVRASGSTDGALGDVDVGGLYFARLDPQLAIATRLGITLPSSSSNVSNDEPNTLAFQSRATDTAL